MTLERARRLVLGDLVWSISYDRCIDVGEVLEVSRRCFMVRWECDRTHGVFSLDEKTWQLQFLFADAPLWPKDTLHRWPIYPGPLSPLPVVSQSTAGRNTA